MTVHVHVFPVDPSLSAPEAWAELGIFGRRVTWTGEEQWGVVECDGDECRTHDWSEAHTRFEGSLVGGPDRCRCEECSAASRT